MEKMKVIALVLFLAGLACTARPVLAQRDPCGDEQTQSGMTHCAAKKLTAADIKLNKAYGELIRKLKSDPAAISLLRFSERAWVDYRKKQCDLISYPTTGGSVQPMITNECWTGLTEDRVKFIQSQLHCEDGDLICLRPRQ
jgi:uncharacterized protein YecT (DUF1311 family)